MDVKLQNYLKQYDKDVKCVQRLVVTMYFGSDQNQTYDDSYYRYNNLEKIIFNQD